MPYEPGQVRMTSGKTWTPRYLVKATVGPEIVQDQPYWEVFHAWRKLMEDWGAKHRSKALFEWKHVKQLGGTGIVIVPARGVSAAELKRDSSAIEAAFYDKSQQAVEEVRASEAEWEKASKHFRTDVMPDFGQQPTAMYTTMIRHHLDPERKAKARSLARKGEAVVKPLGWRKLLKMEPEASMKQIVAALADGKARTFNAISVETVDQTADHTVGTPYEEGLWMGTLNGYIEFTNMAPILFRITPKGKRWLKAGAKVPKDVKKPRELLGRRKGMHAYHDEEDEAEAGPKIPTEAEAKREVTQRAKFLTGAAPDRITIDMPDVDSEYPLVRGHGFYNIGANGGGHINFAWSGTSGWELRTMGFGYDKLPKTAVERLRPILDDAGAKYEPFRVGKTWTINDNASGLKRDEFIDYVWGPAIKALHKKSRAKR
jgi:hypothetical protein